MRYGIFLGADRKQKDFLKAKVHRLVDEGQFYRTLCGRSRRRRIIFVNEDSIDLCPNRCRSCFSKVADQRVEGAKSAERLMSKA